MNIVIPMAGLGKRFVDAGYGKPKPFIDVAGIPMIARVLENLACPGARFILIMREEHANVESETINDLKRRFDVTIIPINVVTEGTACTVLFARKEINNEESLLIANSDQLVDIAIPDYIDDSMTRGLDGSILTFKDPSRNPKWSFAKLGDDGLVVEVQEKNPISEFATVGVYWFRAGHDFVNGAVEMLIRSDRVNGEFYTCPVYNYLIADGKKVGIFNIDESEMHGIGTPEDLESYLNMLKLRGC